MLRALAVAALLLTGCNAILGIGEPKVLDEDAAIDAGARDGPLQPDASPRDAAGDARPRDGGARDAGLDAPPPVTISVTATGDGEGSVTSIPAGISCPTTCAASFVPGTSVELQAAPRAGSRTLGWSGPCAGQTCTFTVGAATTASVGFEDLSRGHNFVFVTAESWPTTDFAPLTGADNRCNDSAAAAGLPGRYVAWISSSTSNARDRLGAARGWVRPDGLPFGDQLSDLTAGRVLHAASVDARGMPVAGSFATNTAADGSTYGNACEDFAAVSAETVWAGGTEGTTSVWNSSRLMTCGSSSRLLCLGVERTAALTYPRESGRVAFVTASTYDGGGLAALDGLCAAAAGAASLAGSFRALVAVGGASAASRFDAGAAPWVRPDGVALVAPGQSLFGAAALRAPLNQLADGTYVSSAVATGAATPTAAGGDKTCSDWMHHTSAQTAISGQAATPGGWFAAAETDCGTAPSDSPSTMAVYCLQE